VLWARSYEATAAVAYAVKYPDRVSHLILCGARLSRRQGMAGQDAYRALILSNWHMASQALVEAMLGSSVDVSSLRWYLRLWRGAVTPEMLAHLLTFWSNTDVRDLLPKVSVPTLVVHYRNDRLIPFVAGR
jgi:pimeloyl-ACP methyl ester carboxylesterase